VGAVGVNSGCETEDTGAEGGMNGWHNIKDS
jgi:hypothetical protein